MRESFDALGDDFQAEVVRHGYDRANNGRVFPRGVIGNLAVHCDDLLLVFSGQEANRLASSRYSCSLDFSGNVLTLYRPQVNDPDLRPRIVAFAEKARARLDAERESPGPEAADRLNEVLSGVRELRIPARDPLTGTAATP